MTEEKKQNVKRKQEVKIETEQEKQKKNMTK